MATDPELHGYDNLRRVHTGPRSSVHRGRRVADGYPVVVKMSEPTLDVEEAFARYGRERDLLDGLTGGGVVRVLDVVRSAEQAAIVFEDIDGISLEAHLHNGRVPLAEALDIAIALTQALDTVHAAGFIHRDVTPKHVIYNAMTHETQLIDFKRATSWRVDNHGHVPAGALPASLAYIAPEQTGRMNRRVDIRADLYSLGVVLFELFSGRLPCESDDPSALVHFHLAVEPPALHEIDAAIPETIADIVMKLLAKAPERRYQTAGGVIGDLRTCADLLTPAGQISRFKIASTDTSERFDVPETLYGRDAEVATILRDFGRVAAGGVATVMVSGPSGMGKTSIVREVYGQVTLKGGYFASGTFDMLWTDVSSIALMSTLSNLVEQLLTESEDALARWRARIVEAIGASGQSVIDSLPSLELIIGPQPPLAPLDAAGALDRYHLTLQKFIQVFARREHPLVLFLDDVQWADSASLDFLQMVAMSPDTESLLILLAYSEDEATKNDALHAWTQALERRGSHVDHIVVGPLAGEHVVALVADALHEDCAAVAALGDIVARKTGSNPFFIREFLHALHADQRIRFDTVTRRFVFDLAAIQNAAITANVVGLLTQNIERLPADSHLIVQLAAAIGTRFDVDTLTAIAAVPREEVDRALAMAIAEGIVLPLSEPESTARRRFAFQHDLIREAAHVQLEAGERERLHLAIGRLLLARAPSEQVDSQWFDVIEHLSGSLSLIVDPAEREQVADFAVRAGGRARAAGAYALAVTSFRCAVELRDWSEDYDGTYQAHLGLADSLHLSHEFQAGLDVLDAARAQATSRRDRAGLDAVKISLFVHGGKTSRALDCCREAAQALGVSLPREAAALKKRIDTTLALIFNRIKEEDIENLVDLPPLRDPDKLAFMVLAMGTLPTAYQVEPQLYVLLAATVVAESMTHGNSSISACGYTMFANILHGLGREDDAARFGKLGFDLVQKLGDRVVGAVVGLNYGAFSAPWALPFATCLRHLRQSKDDSIETDNLAHMAYSGMFAATFALWKDEKLAELEIETELHHQVVIQVGEPSVAPAMGAILGLVRSYRGDGPMPTIDPENARDPKNFAQCLLIDLVKLEQRYLSGDFAGALVMARESQPLLARAPGSVLGAFHRFLHSLAATATWSETERPELEQTIAANQTLMQRWAKRCPENFMAMYLLVEAERARVTGRANDAVEHFEMAIAAATAHGMTKLVALGNELTARFWSSRHKRDIALLYGAKARQLYLDWGATRKAVLVDREFVQDGATVVEISSSTTHRPIAATASESLDLATVLKAARAISGEIVLERLLTMMMEIILENVGAQAAALLLDVDGKMVVRAWKSSEAQTISIAGHDSPADVKWIPAAIINYVVRRRESLVVDDASTDPRFNADATIRARRPRSIICTPIRHKGVLTGTLYLENNLVTGAFTRARLEALNILVAQIAVSIENATLFAKQKQHAETLAAYRDNLAELVADRTKELTDANGRLREESIAREQMEIELRLAQRLQTVGQLAAGVAHEINTPMQYVGSNLEFLNKAFKDVLAILDYTRGEGAGAELDAKRAKRLEFVRKQVPPALVEALEGVKRVTEIVGAMKAFSHPGQKEMAPSDLNEAIQSTLIVGRNEYKYLADLETDLGPLPPVMSHIGEINQVLLNLIVNAAHAIQDVTAGTTDRGLIRLTTRLENADTVVITVTDSGSGIPQSVRDRIFDPFFTTKAVGRGTGQGLAIARSVIDGHGGTLTFETEMGKGTTFFVRLPVKGAPSAAEASVG